MRLAWAGLVASLFVFAINLALSLPAFHVHRAIPANAIRHVDGFAYSVDMRHLEHDGLKNIPGMGFYDDDLQTRGNSSLQILENNISLPLPHRLHGEILKLGSGRFSHWKQNLHFSSSDNTDPRTNGKSYTLSGSLRLSRAGKFLATSIIFLSIALMLGTTIFSHLPKSWRLPTLQSPPFPVPAPQTEKGGFSAPAIALLLGAITFVMLWQLCPDQFQHAFEGDNNIQRVKIFTDYLFEGRPLQKPIPSPYLDGYYILHALGVLGLRGVMSISPFFHSLSGLESQTNFMNCLTNILSWSAAVSVFYGVFSTFGGSRILLAVLSLILATSPKLFYHVNILRVDHLIAPCLVILLSFATFHASGKKSSWLSAMAGIAMALVITTKITGIVFVLIPAIPILMCRRKHQMHPQAFIFLYTTALSLAVLMMRYIIYIDDFFKTFIDSITNVGDWGDIIGFFPIFYYNAQQFHEFDIPLFMMFLAAFPVAIFFAAKQKDKTSSALLAILLVFSLLGMISPKFPRWGYHIAIMYIFIVAHVSQKVFLELKQSNRLFFRRSAAWGVAFVSPLLLFSYASAYGDVHASTRQRHLSEQKVQMAGKAWLERQAQGNASICIMKHAEWQLPPLADGLQYTSELLDFPYLNRKSMSRFPFPDMKNIHKTCQFMILNSYHEQFYGDIFASVGRRKEWQQFINNLRNKNPPQRFEYLHEGREDWMEIYKINPEYVTEGTE